MRIPDFLDLDTVTAADWRAATLEERAEFHDRWRRQGCVSFVCLTCGFPTAHGQSSCEACRPMTRQVNARVILCYSDGRREEYDSAGAGPSKVVLAHDYNREFWPTGELRDDGAPFYKEGTPCEKCGVIYGVGDSPYCKDGHGRVGNYQPFTPYFDFALGAEVTSHAHRWRLMREGKLDYRDKMNKGDLSARLDRVEERKKEEARG